MPNHFFHQYFKKSQLIIIFENSSGSKHSIWKVYSSIYRGRSNCLKFLYTFSLQMQNPTSVTTWNTLTLFIKCLHCGPDRRSWLAHYGIFFKKICWFSEAANTNKTISNCRHNSGIPYKPYSFSKVMIRIRIRVRVWIRNRIRESVRIRVNN